MATLNLGRIKPIFKGAYSGSTAYVIDDIVTSGGSSYICIQAHGAGTQAVTVTAYWSVLASTGTDLASTLTTAGDTVYKGASALTRLAKGTAAQVLTMNAGATAPEWAAGGGGAWDFVSRNAIGGSDVASIVFQNLVTSGENYFFMWNGLDSVNNSTEDLLLQVSTDNGSAYRTTGYESALWQHYSNGGSNGTYNVAGMMLSENQQTNDTTEGNSGYGYLMNLASSQKTFFTGQNSTYGDSSNKVRANEFGAFYDTAEDTDAVRFIYEAGNISANTNGFVTLYKQVIA